MHILHVGPTSTFSKKIAVQEDTIFVCFYKVLNGALANFSSTFLLTPSTKFAAPPRHSQKYRFLRNMNGPNK